MRARAVALAGLGLLAAAGCGSSLGNGTPQTGTGGTPAGAAGRGAVGAGGGGAAGAGGAAGFGAAGEGGAAGFGAAGIGGGAGAGAGGITAGGGAGETAAAGAGGAPLGGASGRGGAGGTPVLPVSRKLDLLFMIDNSSSMLEMQTKLFDQIPAFMNVLQALTPPPSLHIAVISSDMGAPGDATNSIACTTKGDQGEFQDMARGTCTDTTLQNGATFISDVNLAPNYTDPLASVLQCLEPLGQKGCGFEHQLASIDRALGADGMGGVPSTNADFLRADAYLGIVILTNEDDCSAPLNTLLYSLNTGGSNQQNIRNALGPISNYRCNQYGHLCTDPATGAVMIPPLNPPADAQGTASAPTLDLASCLSDDGALGLLTPVSRFISDIKSLKPDPDNEILVAAIAAPVMPYTVKWAPEQGGQNTQAGELWPQIEHSCGALGGDDVNPKATMNTTDGSFGDPSVRITQFASAFPHSVLASICDPSYATSMQTIATAIASLIGEP